MKKNIDKGKWITNLKNQPNDNDNADKKKNKIIISKWK